MVVRLLAKKEDLAVDVLSVYHTKQWILMLVNFEQFFILLDEMLRANVAKNQTFSKYCGNSSKINSAHILMLGRP